MEPIRRLALAFPALGRFLSELEPVFLAWPAFRTRVHDGFLAADREALRESLVRLEAAGVRIPVDCSSPSQSLALWQSDFFRVFLDAVGFFPPGDANPSAALLPPVSGMDEAIEREQRLQSLYGEEDYWKINLRRTYPELYLEPALADLSGRIVGCDLGCGWGRGTLSLRRRNGWAVHCCDRSAPNLRTLQQFVERGGGREVTAHCCDLTRLPLADDSLDFSVAADFFELLPDVSLERVLLELLRCHKPGATLYLKVTLHARAPVLGQVQYFTRDHVAALFSRFTWRGKRLRVRLSDPRLPEHFAFDVVGE